jgi:putative membrane-bound dehydrogenase-like protein
VQRFYCAKNVAHIVRLRYCSVVINKEMTAGTVGERVFTSAEVSVFPFRFKQLGGVFFAVRKGELWGATTGVANCRLETGSTGCGVSADTAETKTGVSADDFSFSPNRSPFKLGVHAMKLRIAIMAVLLTALTGFSAENAPKPLRALLIAGGCCHDYAAQKDILKKGLEARANVVVDVIYTADKSTKARFDIYDNPDWAKGYDVVIHDECSADVKEMPYFQNILNAHKTIPAVNLHCAMHCYRIGTDDWFKFVGIHSTGHGPQEPIALDFINKEHPITKGFENWTTIKEELYNNIKIFPSATPLVKGLQMVPQKDGTTKPVESVVAWVNEYEKTRVFSTTIGHNNATVSDERYLNMLTRGMLWACGKLEAKGYLKAYVAPEKRVNVAKGKPAKASSEETGKGNLAAKAFDGDESTRWCANGQSNKESLEVDLGAPTKLTGVRLVWESDGAKYFHNIEGSADGKEWKVLVDASKTDKSGPYEHDFNADGIRYVRVQYLGKAGGGWGSIRELEVYSTQTEKLSPKQAANEADEKVLKDVKVADGFNRTLFAKPPLVNYPVFIAAAPDGTLYVSSDKNGSLGRDANRGSIVRLRDTDGDGRADEAKKFVANVDSPRGLVWDHDRLYVLHPPHISAFIDKDGDGVADEEKVLVKNIAFTFKDRPADHTSNGIELGMDGWIYCAIGDFGFMEAEGTDGRKLQLRGGGIVRVRPDGTGLELFARGTRNILEAAVSPLLDPFARDNTNDGGGWDVRFHHFTGLEEHGYPSFYKNFNEDMIQPLADYGGGSGCGAAWIDEPGMPAAWNNAPFTADWGRNFVYRHSVTPKGATFVEKEKPVEFVGATRTTDLDVDASTRIYVASWKGATFNYAGEDVGYIVQVTPKGFTPEALPNFAKATEVELVKLLESPSYRRRLEAQRTLIRRGLKDETVKALTTLAGDNAKPLASRVAAVFALKQGLGAKSVDALVKLAAEPTIAAWVIRALTDREDQLANVPAKPIVAALKSTDDRTRKEAVVSIARLGKVENATALTPLLGENDATIAHTTIQALKRLHAIEACFAVVDTTGASASQRAGALQALRVLHEAKVVDGIISRLNQETVLERRKGLISALCRLYFTEGKWAGDSWGTRPDTTGPYYNTVEWAETPKISAALKVVLAKATGEEAGHLVAEFNRHKIQSDDTLSRVITLAAKDASLVPAAVGQLSRADKIPPAAMPFLVQAAMADDTADIPRANAVIALSKADGAEAVKAMLVALPKLAQVKKTESNGTERERRLAREAFMNSTKLDSQHAVLTAEAAKMNDTTSVLADAALLKIADRKSASPEAREAAKAALENGWNEAKRRAQILRAVQAAEYRPYKDKVLLAMDDTNKEVAKAAKAAANTLKLDPAKDKPAAHEKLIADMKVADVVAAILKTKGDVKVGEQLFTQQGCVNCHTIRTDEPPKGPFLGNIATTYKRPDLAEAVLLPNKTIAQGFVANHFVLKDETEYDGFVTLEAADKVVIRIVTAQEITIPVKNIVKRDKLDRSIMPEGLAGNLSVKEFASLLDYLEALAKK